MYIYIHIYVYIHIYIHIYIYTYIHTFILCLDLRFDVHSDPISPIQCVARPVYFIVLHKKVFDTLIGALQDCTSYIHLVFYQ